MDETRFDTLARTLSTTRSRRTAVRTMATAGLGLSLAWLGLHDAAAGRKKKKKGNGKNTGKNPKKPKLPKTPAGPDVCDATWPDAANQNHCRFMREQCPRDPAHLGPFCIVNRHIGEDIHQVADCCPPGYSCCDGACVDLTADNGNCGSSCANRMACGAGEFCTNGSCIQICLSRNCPPGQGCVTSRGYLCNGQPSGDCQCGCGPGLKYCPDVYGGICVSANSGMC